MPESLLPWLATDGNRIVRQDTGDAVLLRGLNRSGLEYTEPRRDAEHADANSFLHAANITREEVRVLCEEWHSNVLRLPFNQDFALRGRRRRDAAHYLEALDQVVNWAAEFGAYTMLDLQWLQADEPWGPDREFIYPVPNQDSIGLWRMLAQRYKDRPEVLYDLYTEPHDCDPITWSQWAQLMGDAIWQENARAQVYVAGTGWGFDLRGVDITGPNVVYSTHIYKKWGDDWDGAFLTRSREKPVFAGEWGCWNGELPWGQKVLDCFAANGIGWTAWSWSDQPRILQDGQITDYGKLVRDALV